MGLAHASAGEPLPVVSLHYREHDKLIYLPVSINGANPVWFCLDSGASFGLLDSSFVNELGLRTSGGKEVSGTGAGSIPTRSVGRVTADLKGARFTMSAPIVVDLSKVPIPNWTRGLVGAELFENYVV